MTTKIVIEEEIVDKARDCIIDICVSWNKYVFVFYRAPEAFDEDVVEKATATIHAVPDVST